MCSTPKPKRRVKVKTANASVGILSGMSSEKRQSFAQRANQASARRIEAKKLKLIELDRIGKSQITSVLPQDSNISLQKSNQLKRQNKSVIYWLLSASVSDIFRRLLMGK